MIPILYGAAETAFTSNGLGRLVDAKRCEVMEVKNGEYELELDYPLTGAKFDKLQLGTIISAIHDDRGDRQPFVIYQRTAPLDGIVTFNARHISYELGTVVAVPFSASSAVQALAGLKSNSVNTNRFNFSTDITTLAPFALTEPMAVRGAMGGVEGSILDVYGGEYKFNNFDVQLLAHRGQNTGVTIRYGKNLTDLRHITDGSEAYNAVVPFWAEENEDTGNVLVMLPERIVTAAGVTDPVAVPLDLSQDFEEQPTEAQLRAAAQQHLADLQPWEPDVNLTLDFINLADTLEYEDVLNLQRLSLCDTVNVIYTALGVTAENIQIIKTTYDVLAERYIKMELGTARSTYAQVIEAQTDAKIRQSEKLAESFFSAAIHEATEVLKGANGGHVRLVTDANGEPQEILILDTDDLDTATNILRISLNGIGFSTDGGETYATAWTITGRFIADWIQSGTLRTIMIQGPNGTGWNLTTGRLTNYDESTVTAQVETSEGTYTPVTYDVKHTLVVDDGLMQLSGEVDDSGEELELFSLGLEGEGMDYDFFEITPGGDATAYPYAGLKLRGPRIKGRARDGNSGGGQHDQSIAVTYIPGMAMTPDYIELGQTSDVLDENDQPVTQPPNRNMLHIGAGWTEPEESIYFMEYYRRNGSRPYYERLKHRVAWEYAHGDIAGASPRRITFYGAGILLDSKREVRITVPVCRPIAQEIDLLHTAAGGSIIRMWQNGSVLLSNDDGVEASDTRVYAISDGGVVVGLRKQDNTAWTSGGTNRSVVAVEVIDFAVFFGSTYQ